jgi:hypothetical protein
MADDLTGFYSKTSLPDSGPTRIFRALPDDHYEKLLNPDRTPTNKEILPTRLNLQVCKNGFMIIVPPRGDHCGHEETKVYTSPEDLSAGVFAWAQQFVPPRPQ